MPSSRRVKNSFAGSIPRPGGTKTLVILREHLLGLSSNGAKLDALDSDL